MSTAAPFTNEDLPARLQKLEAHVAHLEHHLDQLNEVVVEQEKLLTRLRKEVQRQSDALQAQELEQVRANTRKPPHYL